MFEIVTFKNLTLGKIILKTTINYLLFLGIFLLCLIDLWANYFVIIYTPMLIIFNYLWSD